LLRLGVAAGCKVSNVTDARAPGQVSWQAFGCVRGVVCRVEPDRIVNTWSADELLSWTGRAAAG
jgi:putative hydrolase